LFHCLDRWNTWEKSLELKGISLQAVELNLVDEVWKEVGGRPAHPSEPIFSLPMKFAGEILIIHINVYNIF